MVSNLRLGTYGKSVTLTSEDSDVTSDFTIGSSAIINAAGANWDSVPDMAHVFDRSNATYGNWYNWYTATAGSGTTSLTHNVDASQSICPLGWKLPSSLENDFQQLATAYSMSGSSAASSTKAQSSPLQFSLAGEYTSGKASNTGVAGRYWTHTAYFSSDLKTYDAYYMRIYSANFNPGTVVWQRSYGLSVRCVSK